VQVQPNPTNIIVLVLVLVLDYQVFAYEIEGNLVASLPRCALQFAICYVPACAAPDSLD